jgi:hypothetical protein
MSNPHTPHVFAPDVTGVTCRICGGWPDDASHTPSSHEAVIEKLTVALEFMPDMKGAGRISARSIREALALLHPPVAPQEAGNARLRELRDELQELFNDGPLIRFGVSPRVIERVVQRLDALLTAAAPDPVAPHAETEKLKALAADWREAAKDECAERGPGWVGAESSLRKCADELEALLRAGVGHEGRT